MANTLAREVRAMVASAEAQGYRTREKKSGTMILGNSGAVMIHHTPSDPRGVKNAAARLRAIGVVL